jgi:hypothetical protein
MDVNGRSSVFGDICWYSGEQNYSCLKVENGASFRWSSAAAPLPKLRAAIEISQIARLATNPLERYARARQAFLLSGSPVKQGQRAE